MISNDKQWSSKWKLSWDRHSRLQELSRHPDPGPAYQVVPRCSPPSLIQPPDLGTRCLLGGLTCSFPVGSRSGLDMWYRSLAFGGGVQSISSAFGGYCHLLVVAWSVSRELSLLLMVSGHQIQRILLRQVLMSVWIFFSVAAVVLHVSAPYSRTGFTVVLMILILMLMVRLYEAQMFFIWRKAVSWDSQN